MSEQHIKGLRELQGFLDKLPALIERNVLRSSLRAGAKVLLAEAIYRAPAKSGALVASLKIGTRARGGTVTASVKTNIWYAKWVEYGTRAHDIAAKKGGWLSFGGIFSKEVMHPGAKPHPFLRPALDAGANGAVVETARAMRRTLETKHGLDTAGVMLDGDE